MPSLRPSRKGLLPLCLYDLSCGGMSLCWWDCISVPFAHVSLRDCVHPSATVRIVVSDLGDEPIQELSPWLPQLPVAEGPMVAVEIISIARQN